MRLISRQLSWIRAAFGFYPLPMEEVERFSDQGWVGYRDSGFPEQDLSRLLEAFHSKDSRLHLVHRSGHRLTYKIKVNRQKDESIYLKHYQCKKLNLFNPRNYLRFGHALKSFRLFYRMNQKKVLLARLLFCLRESKIGIRSDRLLGSVEVGASQELRSWVREEFGKLPEKERSEFVIRFAEFMAGVHGAGILHRDLETNTLLCFDPLRFHLIDFDGIRIFGTLMHRDRVKELQMLMKRLPEIGSDPNMSRRFMEAYRFHYS